MRPFSRLQNPSILGPSIIILISTLQICFAIHQEKTKVYEEEYQELHSVTDDKDGLESIRALHQQLDDDNDGTIEPSETGDFIREDLQYRSSNDQHQQQMRQKRFHKHDSEITVKDLWGSWWKSEVHNWTVDQTVEWLVKSVGLPQYEAHFRNEHVTGAKLPQIAVGSSYLTKVLGVTNQIHKSKITLKAMDVVLFGPPKEPSSTMKDIILTSLLALAISGLVYAYRQNKKSQEHLKRMINDMEGLSKAEETLKDLQEKLHQRDEKLESMENSHADLSDMASTMEVSRLKEEVEVLRNELHRAEIELEDRCWLAPAVLQHWLQLTYELESQTYNSKKKAAELQLEMAKDMCEKLKRKRLSLVGAFVSTHGGSIDDVDRSILEAKTALLEVTQDLTERTQRWRQIEVLCGCSIMSNPGMIQLQKIVRHVGVGRLPSGPAHALSSQSRAMSSRMSSSLSQEDLLGIDDNMDTLSVAASSSHMTSSSSSQMSRPQVSTPNRLKRTIKPLMHGAREMSKESTSSDEIHEKVPLPEIVHHNSPAPSLVSSHASSSVATPPVSKSSPALSKSGSIGEDLQVKGSDHSSDATPPPEPETQPPVLNVVAREADNPKIIFNATPPPSNILTIPDQLPLSVSQPDLRSEGKAGSEDSASISSDISAVSKKKKKTFFISFGRKKEKQKDIH